MNCPYKGMGTSSHRRGRVSNPPLLGSCKFMESPEVIPASFSRALAFSGL